VSWKNEGSGRYSAITGTGQGLVVVPEYGHHGNNIYGYQLYRVGPDDEQELLVSKKRLKDVFDWAAAAGIDQS
jgi:hypothetical protein